MSPERTAETYQKHNDRVRAIVRAAVTASREDVDDALSFAWLQFLTHEVSPGAEVAWLTRTAAREAIRLRRREQRDANLLPEHENRPDQTAAARESIREALGALSPLGGRVLLAKGFGYTTDETMKRLGVSRRAVLRGIGEARAVLAPPGMHRALRHAEPND